MLKSILLLILFITQFTYATDTIDLIKNNLIKSFIATIPMGEEATWNQAEFENYFKNFDERTMKFKDLNYEDPNNLTWGPVYHIIRIYFLAIAYNEPKHYLYHDPRTIKMTNLTAKLFDANHYQNPNWWMNMIGIPLRSYATMLLLENKLESSTLNTYLRLTEQAERIQGSGQNLLWFSEIFLGLGVIKKNESLIAEAAQSLWSTISTGGREGLQIDNSFYQHGAVLYNGGYGFNFAIDTARFISILGQTPYRLDDARLNAFISYVLDAQVWMTRGVSFNYSASGRNYARPGFSSWALLPTCKYMMSVPHARKQEFIDCVENQKNLTPQNVSGNKHFWLGEFMIQYQKDFSFSVKNFSKNVITADTTPLSEGILNDYISDGVTFFIQKGEEYQKIFSVLDYTKLPGTTETDATLLGLPDQRMVAVNDFIGGVSNGQTGISFTDFARGKLVPSTHYSRLSTMDFNASSLIAKKSWFLTSWGMVALGANINHTGRENYNVFTTINQTWNKGDVIVKTECDQITLNEKNEHYKGNDVQWVYHNGLAYFNLVPATLKINNQIQIGSWNRIYPSQPNKPESGRVFSLWYEHGLNPINNQYAYAVVSTQSLENTQNLTLSKYFKLLSNTKKLQAIDDLETKTTSAVFFSADEIIKNSLHGNIKVNSPSAVILNDEANNKVKLTLSSPLSKRQILVTLSNEYTCSSCKYKSETNSTDVLVSLPTNIDQMNKSVITILERNR